MVETNIIPETLVNNSTLQSILLTQIMLETLNGISVPKAPQGNNFAYLMSAKEMIMWKLGAKNAKDIKSLEEQTDVNLDHYYKLNINQEYRYDAEHTYHKTNSASIWPRYVILDCNLFWLDLIGCPGSQKYR